MIERLLKRAAEREAQKAGKSVKAVMRSGGGASRGVGKLMAGLGRELGKALKHRGDVGGRPSIRQRAPDTGGKPFHFAHSVVGKSDVPASASGKPIAGSGKTGRAAAHMRYIEREMAVERLYAVGAETSRDAAATDRQRDDGSFDREPGRDAHETAAAPGQAYIENPVKLESGEHVLFSFGTIGDRFDDRLAFWQELEQAETHPNARVQHRLIVELPHEASPQARFEMIQAFTKRFVDDGIPFHAALHAPGAKNDARNFHAHIVYSERPAKRITDPETGEQNWDFAVVKRWTDSSRHARESRPYRQDKLRAYHDIQFITKLRKEFADVVTKVLERDDVKDSAGKPVRYDARSYKDMGLDVVPIQSINRIVADKIKLGKQTSLDGDYTKRMLATEIRDAAGRWDKSVHDLVALDDALQAAALSGKPQTFNKALPRELRGPLMASIPRKVLAGAGKKILEARRAALHLDVMERASVASLERIVAATAPKTVEAASRSKDAAKKAEAPDREAAAMLHAAALEELAETKASVAKARRTAQIRVGAAVNAWKDLVNAPAPETSPRMKAIIRDIIDSPAPAPAPAVAERTATQAKSQAAERSAATTERSKTVDGEKAAAESKTSTAKEAAPVNERSTFAKPVDGERKAEPSRPVANRNPSPQVEATKATSSGGTDNVGQAPRSSAMPVGKSSAKPKGPINPLSFLDQTFRIPTIEDLTGPLHPRLRQADAAVRNIFKIVRDSSDDPDVRMRTIEEITERLGIAARDNSRACKAEAAKRERSAEVESEPVEPTPRGASRPGVNPDQLDLGFDPIVVKEEAKDPASNARAIAETGAPSGSAGSTEPAASTTGKTPDVATKIGVTTDRLPRTTDAAEAPSETPAERSSTPKTKEAATVSRPPTGPNPSTMPETTTVRAEDPDAARRRRKREADEKAAKKRRAVLARQNRGHGR